MGTSITKRYHFESAHWLPFVAEDHKCHRIHGHNYEVEITVAATDGFVQDNGFIMDFWDLDKAVQPLLDLVDHRTLNDIGGLNNPTAELIARWFFQRIAPLPTCNVVAVRVYETKDCWADFHVE